MTVMPTATQSISYHRAPRAQFFANRALIHIHALTSFDEIIGQQTPGAPMEKKQESSPEINSFIRRVFQPR